MLIFRYTTSSFLSFLTYFFAKEEDIFCVMYFSYIDIVSIVVRYDATQLIDVWEF